MEQNCARFPILLLALQRFHEQNPIVRVPIMFSYAFIGISKQQH